MYVLIPSYEPNERLIALVAELRTADPRIRILVVDDGSGERFAAVFDRAALAGATVVHHTHNRGKGAALRTGFSWIRDHARGDVIVTADADGQHTVRDILAVANRTDMEFLTSIGLPLWLAKVITELALFALSFRAQKNAVFSSHTAAGVRGNAAGADSSPRFTESHPAS